MSDKFCKVKKLIKIINDNSGFLTLIVTIMVSISVFLFDLFLSRYEIGYSSFFGLKKILRTDYDYIGIFFTFFIVSLVFILVYRVINPTHKNIEKEKRMRSEFSIHIMLIMLIVAILYLYVLTKITLTTTDILKCIILPAIPLFIMVYKTLILQNSKSYITLIVTIFLTFTTIICVEWSLFNSINFVKSAIILVFILVVSGYLPVTGWIVNKVIGEKKNNNEKTSKKVIIKWTNIHVVTTIIIIVLPIAVLLISFTSSGWEDAKRTTEIYMTVYNNKEYILFEQSDYYIALPIEKINENSTENKISMKSIKNEYTYLSKENILVQLIKVDKIEKQKDDSVVIELSKNVKQK